MPTLKAIFTSATFLLGLIQSTYASYTEQPLPCNGFPEYKDLPVNYFFWLGVHNAGLSPDSYQCPDSTQARPVTDMLQDGIRHLDLNLCTRNGETTLCSSDNKETNISFSDYLAQVFDYVRQVFQQVVVLNINSIVDDPDSVVTFKEMETIIDRVCKTQADRTLGTNEYEQYKCPFIYVQPEYTMDWPSLGELVYYDPETAAWEGDGEDVGVQSKIIFTHGESIRRNGGDMSHYFSKVFARHSNFDGKLLDDSKSNVHTLCQSNGPISLQVYSDQYNDKYQASQLDDITLIEDAILSKEGCDLNSAGLHVYFNMIQLDRYHQILPYLKDLQARMNKHNYAKYQGQIEPVPQSTETMVITKKKEKRPEKDEL
ncbi:uncharacterized protein BX664DRAFT_319530 [Halteromyces radiatus]|uniref:uncharacterized protein n=1 Tax=Halteromyces radiatus TaxID=101107 RepID=UPI00221E57F7|nr:uncharacterized protein BX664DRAFT_319530 [Halteromyces radiatus]KAI8098760.1 hypothetical protein BX664DRAFT_319530 [Halteromyces radiatus]